MENSNNGIKIGHLVKKWAAEECPKSPTGKASNYITQLDQYREKHPDMKVIFYGRVSSRTQGRKKNLKNQKIQLESEHINRNIPTLGYYREICSGRIIDDDRWALVAAVREAKKHNAVIVAASTDRFLRNYFYESDHPEILPTEHEYEKLKKLTGNIPLLTLLDPDMDPLKVRGYQSKWGQGQKGKRGGRPRERRPGYKKQIREEKLPDVLRLYRDGKSIGYIAKMMDLAWSTVKDWVTNK
jgi:DNA invertase Pin-like site-specific DNA recombinase